MGVEANFHQNQSSSRGGPGGMAAAQTIKKKTGNAGSAKNHSDTS